MERVQPYLPSCSSYSLDDFAGKWEERGSAFNLSSAGNYVYDEVVPSLIPGLVLGGLALLGFLLFVCWACISCCCACLGCCCKRCRKAPPPRDDVAATQQFISSGAQGGAPSAYADLGGGKGGKGKRLTWRNAFWAFFMLLGLAAVGVGAWGMAESIKLTDSTVTDFWSIVDDVQFRVEQSIAALGTLRTQATALAEASTALTNEAAVSAGLEQAGVPFPDQVAGFLANAPQLIGQAPAALEDAALFLEQNIEQTILDLESKFEPPTMAVQDTWRFITIAVLFGLLILVVLLTMLAAWFMTWPRTTALLVALLWLMTALLMLLGAGLLNGVVVVSDDACLFVESFVVDYAARKTRGKPYSPAVVGMIKYYINATDQTDEIAPYLPNDDSAQVSAIETYADGIRGSVTQLTELSLSPVVKRTLIASGLPEAAATALQSAAGAVQPLVQAADELAKNVLANNTGEVYRDTKEWICCGIKETANDMWISWTTTGVLAFVFALLASGRLIQAAMQRRRAHKLSQTAAPGAAVLWTPPPAAGGSGDGYGAYPPAGGAPYQTPTQMELSPAGEGDSVDAFIRPGGASASHYPPSAPPPPPADDRSELDTFIAAASAPPAGDNPYNSSAAYYAPVRDSAGAYQQGPKV